MKMTDQDQTKLCYIWLCNQSSVPQYNVLGNKADIHPSPNAFHKYMRNKYAITVNLKVSLNEFQSSMWDISHIKLKENLPENIFYTKISQIVKKTFPRYDQALYHKEFR
jgi:hypothetical protein